MRAGLTVVVTAAAAVLVACGSAGHPDRDAARAYLDAYAARDVATAAAATTDVGLTTTVLQSTLDALPGATPHFTVTGSADDPTTTSTVTYRAAWTFPGVAAQWTYDATLALSRGSEDADWKVRAGPEAVAPGLATGQHLGVERTQPTRANLLDSDGTALFTQQDVVTVGIDPGQVGDLASVAAALAAVPELQTTADQVVADVQAAPAGQFVPVITLRRAVYESVKDRIYDLPGVQFPTGTALLGPTSTFAQPLLGRVGPATAEQVQASKGAVAEGDVVGQGGLQAALDPQLRGTPGLTVDVVGSDGTKVRDLARVSSPVPGSDVALTLDRDIQTAADATLADVALPAALVVTQPSTGRVLAVADNAAADGDIAIAGQYPPGSTFKIATYTGVFAQLSGVTPDSPVDCPATITVNGQTVRNENEFAKGTITAGQAFAFSCNTSAAGFALQLPAAGLSKAAASLGLGQKWDLPVDAFSGSMPDDAQSNELAAEGYGQGQTLVSPLLMAEMVGGAQTGTAIAPSLLADHAGAKLPAQPAAVTTAMRTLLRDVVTVPGATGRALADLPGQVGGKTGTAEYGTGDPPKSHSWFSGVRGDLAFAVFVAGGEGSTTTAVPLARTFLQAVPPS